MTEPKLSFLFNETMFKKGNCINWSYYLIDPLIHDPIKRYPVCIMNLISAIFARRDDWSSDVCSFSRQLVLHRSHLVDHGLRGLRAHAPTRTQGPVHRQKKQLRFSRLDLTKIHSTPLNVISYYKIHQMITINKLPTLQSALYMFFFVIWDLVSPSLFGHIDQMIPPSVITLNDLLWEEGVPGRNFVIAFVLKHISHYIQQPCFQPPFLVKCLSDYQNAFFKRAKTF